MAAPSPDQKFPLKHYDRLCFLKNVVKNPNIIVGDYTYYDDFESVENFEKNVKYHFDFIGDKLIIGKYCQIASDVEFIMNGANHLQEAVSTFPFAIFGEDWSEAMKAKAYPSKGDTIIGNDVWIGYGALVMPGVKVGDGAIIASRSVVTKDVAPYAVVGGNPAELIRKRFDAAQIDYLLDLQWWDWEPAKVSQNLELLTSPPAKT